MPMRGIQSDGRGSEVYLTAQLYQGSKTVTVDATLDTGSFYSVLPAKYVGAASLQPTNIKLVAANGSDISVLGRARIRFTVEGVRLYADVLVSNAVDEWLLGYDFLCENRCLWNFADAIITVSGRELRLKRRCNLNYVRRVIASDNVVVPGNSAVHVPVKLAYTDIMHVRPSNWLIEPRVVGEGLLMPRSLFDNSEDAVVRLVNPTNGDLVVKRDYVFGNAEPLAFHCRVCGEVCMCVPDAPGKSVSKIRSLIVDPAGSGSAVGEAVVHSNAVSGVDVMTDDEIVLPMLKSLPDCITEAQRVEIEAILRRHVDVFSRHEYDVGLTNVAEYKLELKDPRSSPVAEPLRQHPYAYLDIIDREVDRLLSANIIAESPRSTYSSNIVLVKKKAIVPGAPPRYRLTCDFRALNLRLSRICYPNVNAKLVFDSIRGRSFFSQIDISLAFQSIKLNEETNHLTTFVTRRGAYKWLRLPAGIHSGPAVLNHVTQSIFSQWLWSEVLTFADDITIQSYTVEEGIRLLAQVLGRLRSAGLKLKASKCSLLQTQVKILGFLVSKNSLQEDPERIAVVKALPFPRTKREMRAFLGYVNFSRSFYRNLAEITEPLVACLRKSGVVKETPETMKSFLRLKEIMSSPPILTIFDPNARHYIDCDASNVACGACLIQVDEDGVERIVGYMSKTFSDAERKYCTSRQELLSVIKALSHWRNYVISRPVIVRSDHCALKYLLTSRNLSPQWNRYLDFLADFDIEIQYKPGSQQNVADYLSRFGLRCCEFETGRDCKQCRPRVVGARRDRNRSSTDEVVVGTPPRTPHETHVCERGADSFFDRELINDGRGTDADGSETRSADGETAGTASGNVRARDRCAAIDGEPIAAQRRVVAQISHGSTRAGSSVDCTTRCGEQIDVGVHVDGLQNLDTDGGTFGAQRRAVALVSHSPTRAVVTADVTVDRKTIDARPDEHQELDELAVPFDCGDNSGVCVDSRRVQTRAQLNQQAGHQGRRGRPNVALKLPDVSVGSRWTLDEITRLQGQDAVLSEVRRRLSVGNVVHEADHANLGVDPDVVCYVRQLDSLIDKDGVLYRRFVDVTGATKFYQLLLPPSMRAAMMELVHDDSLCHVRMLHKNEHVLQQHAYWPTWKRDLRVYVMACNRCAEFHTGKLARKGGLRPSGNKLTACGQFLSIDLTGKHPSSNGFHYCLTAIDCFSKYLFMVPLRDKTAAHVAHALVQIFLKHGFYSVIKSDNGGEFISELQAELDKLLGVTRLTTIPYMPRQNPVERVHRSINAMFAKVLDRHVEWSAWLPYIAFAYNSTLHKSTGFTPHFLHFGRELASSITLLLANPTDEHENYGEYARQMIDRMTSAHEIAREVLNETALQAKREYDVKVRLQTFEQGDIVLVYCPRKRRQQYPKWQRLFSTQARVLSRVNEITYIVQFEHSRKRRIVHVDKLKLLSRPSVTVEATDH